MGGNLALIFGLTTRSRPVGVLAVGVEGAATITGRNRTTYPIDQRIGYDIVVVGELRQRKATLLLQRLLQVGRLRRHGVVNAEGKRCCVAVRTSEANSMLNSPSQQCLSLSLLSSSSLSDRCQSRKADTSLSSRACRFIGVWRSRTFSASRRSANSAKKKKATRENC